MYQLIYSVTFADESFIINRGLDFKRTLIWQTEEFVKPVFD